VSFDQAVFNHEVGLRMQMQRKRRERTQADVADALEIPRATYANLEGGRQRIAVDVLWRVAVFLEVPIEKLLPEPIVSRQETDDVTPRQTDFGPVDYIVTTKRS